jgi:Xaa-Pro aminopeptidase
LRIGLDPWLHTVRAFEALCTDLMGSSVELVLAERNPIDALWADRPPPSAAPAVSHSQCWAGASSQDKRTVLAAHLREAALDTAVLTTLDGVAWLFNLRGRDVPHTPVVLAYALLHADASAELFISPEKLTTEVREHLGPDVLLRRRDEFERGLASLAGRRVAIDPERAAVAVEARLKAIGAKVIRAPDPTLRPKARKNAVEIEGHRAAQRRDGVALTRFLHWLSLAAPGGGLDELTAAVKLREFREASGQLEDLSFATISAAGPNAAKPHYRPSTSSNRHIEPNSLYLVDSGAQYLDGTTDVTRTVAIGTPSAEMCDRFTRVLKGHIAVAQAVFPPGTCGMQIDALARQALWAIGLDYGHGTGHGVGAYLSVHEGPQLIARPGSSGAGRSVEAPLEAGMICSNEPAYYRDGEYGIRIENLVLVVEKPMPSPGSTMLGFETLTWAPIDRALIIPSLLTADERAWLDAYHAEVFRVLGPELDPPVRKWLNAATRPLLVSRTA